MGNMKRIRFKKVRMVKREQAKQTPARRSVKHCALSEGEGWAARHGRQRVCGQRSDKK